MLILRSKMTYVYRVLSLRGGGNLLWGEGYPGICIRRVGIGWAGGGGGGALAPPTFVKGGPGPPNVHQELQ